jgi:hypothetical protein
MKIGTTELVIGGVLLFLLINQRSRKTTVPATTAATTDPVKYAHEANQRAQRIGNPPTPEILCYHQEV